MAILNFICTTYMIFVMIFETLQHGILANKGAKSALKLGYQKTSFSFTYL